MFELEHQVGLSVVILRGGVLLVAALTAGMSIFLGWQLLQAALFNRPARDLNSATTEDSETKVKEIQTKGRVIRFMAGVAGVLFAIYGMMFLAYLAYSQSDITENLISAAPEAAMPSTAKPGAAR